MKTLLPCIVLPGPQSKPDWHDQSSARVGRTAEIGTTLDTGGTLSRVGRVARIIVVVAGAITPSAALASGSSSQVWAINCFREQYKPKEIVLACGDGATWLANLSWSSWSGATASGRGAYKINDCTPTCVSGQAHSYSVAIVLSKPGSCPGQRHRAFRRLAVAFGHTRPQGVSTRLDLPCPST